MVHADYLQWDRYSSRAQGIIRGLKKWRKILVECFQGMNCGVETLKNMKFESYGKRVNVWY